MSIYFDVYLCSHNFNIAVILLHLKCHSHLNFFPKFGFLSIFICWFLSVCACVYACLRARAHTWVCTHVGTRAHECAHSCESQRPPQVSFFGSHPPFVPEKDLSLSWSLGSMLALTGQWAPEVLSPPPSAGTVSLDPMLCLSVVLGIQVESSCLCGKHLTDWAIYLALINLFIIKTKIYFVAYLLDIRWSEMRSIHGRVSVNKSVIS